MTGRYDMLQPVRDWERVLEDLRQLFAGDLAPETKIKAAAETVRLAIAGLVETPGPALEPQACTSCGAPIIWLRTVAGKQAPCEVRRLSVTTTDGRTVLGHESHFAHCPEAAKHRKPTKEQSK